MHRNICLGLFLFFAHFTIAQDVLIRGQAESYPGKKIAVYEFEDLVSSKKRLLQISEVDADGSFSLSFPVTETHLVTVQINRTVAIMYVEPSHVYECSFPSDLTAEIKRFDRTEVELDFLNLEKSDLNLLIRQFNTDFTVFISEHFYDFAVEEYKGSDDYIKMLGEKVKGSDIYKNASEKDSLNNSSNLDFGEIVEGFIQEMDEKYDVFYDNKFFHDFVEYSLAELELISGLNRKVFYAKYFMSRNLPWLNPAFMKCFDLYYSSFLLNRSSELQASIVKTVNVERDPQKLVLLFEDDSTALSQQIRSMAIIKGLKEIHNNKTFSRSAVEKTLFNFKSESEFITKVATNTLNQLRKNKEGWLLENFTLLDENENRWTLNDHAGTPVYFLFFAAWNANSIKELQLMQKWNEKYGREILFVAISLDDDYGTFRKYIAENSSQSFTFLFGNSDPLITDKLSISSIPQALFVDEQLRTLASYTRKPTEGIQAEFDKIMLLNQSKKTGPKTWKE